MAYSSVRSFMRVYTPFSILKMALWRFRKCGYPLKMRLRDGTEIELRGGTHAHTDRWIASEIFIDSQYVPPLPLELTDIRQIVDVGANVGYSVVYFLSRFPQAKITAFEPHPAHIQQIQRHTEMNHLQDRSTIYPAAAGISDGNVLLSDGDATSSIVSGLDSSRTISVPVIDWFQHLPEGVIDLLKIDIEGAEFALMNDLRFDEVAKRTRVLTLEWHCTQEYPDARAWCANRVQSLGMTIYDGVIQYGSQTGTFWAVHS